MSQKWNLQDIRPVEPKKRRPVAPPAHIDEEKEEDEVINITQPPKNNVPHTPFRHKSEKKSRTVLYAAIVFFVIVGSALGLSAVLGKTELTIYPENRTPNINSEFTAYPDNRAGELTYEIMTLESTAESQVKASGQVEVEELATGTLEIFKTTPGSERLIKNTRFRSPDGLIYRITESVVVPGASDSAPGSVRAEVFADDIGEAYNLAAGTRFDIPGFEESGLNDLYDAMYAENGEAFTGGFAGPQYQIEENELQTARQELQLQLRDALLARVDSQRPAGFIAFPGSVAISYNQLPAVEYGEGLVTIKEQAVLQIPLFNATDFGAFLAEETVPTYDGGPVRVEDPSALVFNYSNATTSSSVIRNEESLTFTLSGKPLLVWEYDVEKLKKDLAGLPKTAVNNAISAYPGIDGARVSITPFWKRTFPDDPEDIKVTEELRSE